MMNTARRDSEEDSWRGIAIETMLLMFEFHNRIYTTKNTPQPISTLTSIFTIEAYRRGTSKF